jgi:hypothetical protein
MRSMPSVWRVCARERERERYSRAGRAAPLSIDLRKARKVDWCTGLVSLSLYRTRIHTKTPPAQHVAHIAIGKATSGVSMPFGCRVDFIMYRAHTHTHLMLISINFGRGLVKKVEFFN